MKPFPFPLRLRSSTHPFFVVMVILQALAVKGYSRVIGLAFRSWYLSMRILLTSLLNYR